MDADPTKDDPTERSHGEAESRVQKARREIGGDIEEGLGRLFPPDPGRTNGLHLVADLDAEGRRRSDDGADDQPLSDAPVFSREPTAAVAWRYYGIDSVGVQGLAPSDRPVTIRGVTVYGVDNELFHRYIDWLDVYAQLGLSLNARAVAAPSRSVPGSRPDLIDQSDPAGGADRGAD